MSRIGKKPVVIPAGVTAKVEGQSISVKGGKGELSFTAPDHVSVVFADSKIAVTPRDDSKQARAMWGMTRSMVNNLVIGVSKGFERKLEITGVGYKAAVSGKNLQLSLGYSHDVQFPDSRRDCDRRAKADGNLDHRHRQASGRADRRRNSRLAPARAL